jgi:hypothetical protein
MTSRNYTVVGIVADGNAYRVKIRKRDGSTALDATCAEFGVWGLTRKERGIVRRGLTASGGDRNPRRKRAA